MSSTWVMEAESSIFTILKKKVEDKYKTKYADMYFTRETVNDDLSRNLFPTVYVFFSEVETGRDLDNTTINAVSCTMEVQVTSSKLLGFECARNVIYYALDIAKQLRFNVSMMPEITEETSEAKVLTMRLTRTIGDTDTLSL